jgi:hypothetical protein
LNDVHSLRTVFACSLSAVLCRVQVSLGR